MGIARPLIIVRRQVQADPLGVDIDPVDRDHDAGSDRQRRTAHSRAVDEAGPDLEVDEPAERHLRAHHAGRSVVVEEAAERRLASGEVHGCRGPRDAAGGGDLELRHASDVAEHHDVALTWRELSDRGRHDVAFDEGVSEVLDDLDQLGELEGGAPFPATDVVDGQVCGHPGPPSVGRRPPLRRQRRCGRRGSARPRYDRSRPERGSSARSRPALPSHHPRRGDETERLLRALDQGREPPLRLGRGQPGAIVAGTEPTTSRPPRRGGRCGPPR